MFSFTPVNQGINWFRLNIVKADFMFGLTGCGESCPSTASGAGNRKQKRTPFSLSLCLLLLGEDSARFFQSIFRPYALARYDAFSLAVIRL